jgi:excisionase family DNA binding protein
MMPDALTVREAAHRLGFTLDYVYKLLYTAKLGGYKPKGSRTWIIPIDEIKLFEANRRKANHGR